MKTSLIMSLIYGAATTACFFMGHTLAAGILLLFGANSWLWWYELEALREEMDCTRKQLAAHADFHKG